MDSTLFTILLGAVVATGAWGIWRLIASLMQNDKRLLKQRLSGESTQPQKSSEKSIIVQVEAANPRRQGRGPIAKLARQLSAISPGTSVNKLLSICGGIAFGVMLLAFVISNKIVIAVVIGAVAGYIPIALVRRKANKRQQALAMQLPEALDFLSRILRAGHSLSTGLQMLGTELPEPLSGEFRKCYDQHSLGQAMEDSLKDMADRVQSTDFSFFVTAVLIQRQTGGDLSSVLNNISGMIRGRIRLQQYVRAKTAEGRFTGYILVGFPLLMFFVVYAMNPAYAGTLLHTSTGMKLLGTAIGLQTLGLISIRKLTSLRV